MLEVSPNRKIPGCASIETLSMQAYERTLPSVDTIRELYFCSIDGVEGSTQPHASAHVRNGIKTVQCQVRSQ
jgi:hypothetical protein